MPEVPAVPRRVASARQNTTAETEATVIRWMERQAEAAGGVALQRMPVMVIPEVLA